MIILAHGYSKSDTKQEPYVAISASETESGYLAVTIGLTPAAARRLAAELIAKADYAERGE